MTKNKEIFLKNEMNMTLTLIILSTCVTKISLCVNLHFVSDLPTPVVTSFYLAATMTSIGASTKRKRGNRSTELT